MSVPRSLRPLAPLGLCGALAAALSGTGCFFEPPPEPQEYQYVVDRVTLPTGGTLGSLGLDLDGNGTLDNQLGGLFAAILVQGLDLQAQLTQSIDRGDLVLLATLETASFARASDVSLEVFVGSKVTAVPAPCASDTDNICRRHLAGTGMFDASLSAPSVVQAGVEGAITDGAFAGGPGRLALELPLFGPVGLKLDLVGARVSAPSLSAGNISRAVIGGAMTETDVQTKLVPQIHAQLVSLVQADCGPTGSPPACGCKLLSRGLAVLAAFDDTPRDCALTTQELTSSSVLAPFLEPDVRIDGVPALSLAVEASAVRATIREVGTGMNGAQ